jgi:hypothetical protein
MDFFTFLFLTVLIGCSIPLMKLWQDGRKQRVAQSDDSVALRREIDALRERIAVLEKIVTDDKYELRRELAELGE